ncbi:hypothetical protein ACFY3E_25470 [Streptomyces griseorubiginosus]|uniref:hypothetical protein n=1 Tax=Streptomyces griseorubiginosus TaxID=67304 RepID=UPI0036AA6ED4
MTGSVRRDLPDRRTVTVARGAGRFLVDGAFGGTARICAGDRANPSARGAPNGSDLAFHPGPGR